ncbi:MAG TPA: hypothetical protein VER33_09265 [Polyangiaceae bacterium]|nr:hypothetical protein [Polyangiaceae bacterium]
MSDADDEPGKRPTSRPYLPPPPSSEEDQPDAVRVPRDAPPSASLEAMMHGHQDRGAGSKELRANLLALGAILLLLAVGLAAYLYP